VLRRLLWAGYFFAAPLALMKIILRLAPTVASVAPWFFIVPAVLAFSAAARAMAHPTISRWLLASAIGIGTMSLVLLIFLQTDARGAFGLATMAVGVVAMFLAILGLTIGWVQSIAREA
jgi:hypothetical protein